MRSTDKPIKPFHRTLRPAQPVSGAVRPEQAGPFYLSRLSFNLGGSHPFSHSQQSKILHPRFPGADSPHTEIKLKQKTDPYLTVHI